MNKREAEEQHVIFVSVDEITESVTVENELPVENGEVGTVLIRQRLVLKMDSVYMHLPRSTRICY